MQHPEQVLRTFARRVQQVTDLAATAPRTESLPDNVDELWTHAVVLLEREWEMLIRAHLEAIRDQLSQLHTRLGARLRGHRVTEPFLHAAQERAAVLGASARDLEAILNDRASADSFRELSDQIAEEGKVLAQRHAIEQALARVDHSAQGCCWKTGLCETQFEPFRKEDHEGTWFARLRPRLKEFGTWLVEERMAPLARDLHKASPVLGDVSQMIEIDIPASLDPGRAKPRTFMRDSFRQLVTSVEDAKVRRKVAKKLGNALTQGPDKVPPLFFLEYFEVLRGNLARRGEAAIRDLTRPQLATEETTAARPAVPSGPIAPVMQPSQDKRKKPRLQLEPGWSYADGAEKPLGIGRTTLYDYLGQLDTKYVKDDPNGLMIFKDEALRAFLREKGKLKD